jgi:AcrR family transcriptional regulator
LEEERRRLVDAFTKVAVDRGYAGTTADEVAAVAGCERAIFDQHFSGVRQCLLAAYDRFFDGLVADIGEAMDYEAPWPQQVKAGVEAAVGFVIESAGAARLFAVEGLVLGPAAVDRYEVAIQRVASLLRFGRQHSAEAAALPPLTELVLVAGAVSLVTSALLTEDQAMLPALAPRLVEVLLLPYVGGGDVRALTA